jgi:uncharacterized membrane protein
MAAPARSPSDDTRVEQTIGNLLRAGVLLAAAVTAAGGAVYLARHGGRPWPDYGDFGEGAPKELRTPQGAAAAAVRGLDDEDRRRGQGRALIALGAMLLIATPVARVVFTVWAFLRRRDRLYVVVTLIVLALLLFSLFYGVGG